MGKRGHGGSHVIRSLFDAFRSAGNMLQDPKRCDMKKYKVRRLVGFGLWALGLLVFLPPSLLEPEGPSSFYHFMLFNGLVGCLLGGFLLVDGANTALDHIAHHQPVHPTPVLGSSEERMRADKHYHPAGVVPEVLEDHKPDDMPAARTLLFVVLALLVVGALIALAINGSGPDRTIKDNAAERSVPAY